MVLLHWPFGNTYAAWRDLEVLYEEGKIRAIGISNFNPDRMIDFIKFNKIAPALNQIETHLFSQRAEEHKWLEKYGVAHQAYAPLGQGMANEMFQTQAVQNAAAAHTERMQENINIFDFELTKKEMAELRTLDTGKPMIGNAQKPELVEFAMTW